MSQKKFCCICRGPADDGYVYYLFILNCCLFSGPLQKCSTCSDVFHIECINRRKVVYGSDNDFICSVCEAEKLYNINGYSSKKKKDIEKELLFKKNRLWDKRLIQEKKSFIAENREDFEVFCTSDR
jgi:hypothetical protein